VSRRTTLIKDEVGTRHVFVAARILADSDDIRTPRRFTLEAPNWDWLTDEDP
jgi:hypothetical protein